jgi:hypothetical protein
MWAITKRAALLTAAVLVAGAGTASAQPYRGHGHFVVGVGRAPFYSPFYYDPFWGPFYPYSSMSISRRSSTDARSCG